MDKKVMDSVCKLIENEIERLSKQPSLDNTTLNQLHVLTDTKKNLLKIETLESSMEGPMMDGYSNRRGMSYMGGGSYDNRMSGSYNMAPQYYQSYDNGYSRDSAYSHLEQAMRDARSDQEREEIRALMTKLYK